MPRRYQEGDEPIPGYRLHRFLGSGGFGEVWDAEGPGRVHIALKMVALDRKQALKEFRSLKLIRNVRHVNLVAILAFWLRDADGHVFDDRADELHESSSESAGDDKAARRAAFAPGQGAELIMAMTLCDKNLLDRLAECERDGHAGIPADELLNYMAESAKALDFLNAPRHNLGAGPVPIQHCDVKPQNIMLLGDAAVVGDFTLARVQVDSDLRTSLIGGSTAYISPEVSASNKPSPTTDQYSLAIGYYECRTGKLPYPEGATAMQVALAAREGRLVFSGAPPAEADVLRKATSRDPKSRYKSCAEMVRALTRAYEQENAGDRGTPSAPVPAAQAATVAASSDWPKRPVSIAAGVELVPGCTLTRELVAGARCRVWEARRPDQALAAIVIRDVQGHAERVDCHALELVRRLNHPRHAKMREIWLLGEDGTLTPNERWQPSPSAALPAHVVVVGDLAERTLHDRLRQRYAERQTGLALEELFHYLRQAAEAIDGLNQPRLAGAATIIHCDVRPVNFLLHGDRLTLGNFARARVLHENSSYLPPGATDFEEPYVDPELTAGFATRWVDQYSLAVTYAQLRLGKLPTPGSSPSSSDPLRRRERLFENLGEAERAVLNRATSLESDRRFSSCQEFVAALQEAAGVVLPQLAAAAAPAAVASVPPVEPEKKKKKGVGSGTLLPSDFEEPTCEPAAEQAPGAAAARITASPSSTTTSAGVLPHASEPVLPQSVPPLPHQAMHDWPREYRTGDEPVPGYRLLGYVGSGRFGKVWKAEGPGGTHVALKIVPLEKDVAIREYRALKLVKNIRDANLIDISAFWVRAAGGKLHDPRNDDVLDLQERSESETARARRARELEAKREDSAAELIVAMKLCDKNLQHRLEECQREGGFGIPTDELLGYMEDAAKAIDFLNAPQHDFGQGPVPIQHCDVKPQNIMLLGSTALVGDFTLARVLKENDNRKTEIGGTLAYISPEVLFDNEPVATTDQYSLAVSYYELRTGKLPFDEALSEGQVYQLLREGALDLSALEGDELAVVRKACSNNPAERFDTCGEFVRALRDAVYGKAHRRRSPWAWTAGGCLVAAAIAVQAYNVWVKSNEPVPSGQAEIPIGETRADFVEALAAAAALLDAAEPAAIRPNAETAARACDELASRPEFLEQADLAPQAALLAARARLRYQPEQVDAAVVAREDFPAAERAVYELFGPASAASWLGADFNSRAEQLRLALARLGEFEGALASLPVAYDWAFQELWKRADSTLDLAWDEANPGDAQREFLQSLASLPPAEGAEGRRSLADRQALETLHDLRSPQSNVGDLLPKLAGLWPEMTATRVKTLAAALQVRVADGADLPLFDLATRALAEAQQARPAIAEEIEPLAIELGVGELRLRLAQPAEPDWKSLAEKCESLDEACTRRNVAQHRWLLRAARAECAIEAAAKDEGSQAVAREWIRDIPADQAAGQSYDDYVATLVEPPPAAGARGRDAARERAERLLGAWSRPGGDGWQGWQTAPRRSHSAARLLDAAEAVAGLGEAAVRASPRDPFSAAGDQAGALADRTFSWLQAAREMAGSKVDRRLHLNLAAAACYKSQPDLALAAERIGLYAPEKPDTQARLIEALALRESDPARALPTFADLVDELRGRELPRGDVFRWVLEPALQAAKRQSAHAVAAELSPALARLYAAWGRFLQEDSNPSQFALADSPSFNADEAAYLAFDKAVSFDPENMAYHVDRGLARLEWQGAQTDFDDLYNADIRSWKEDAAAQPTPGGYSLLARMRIWQSRRPERSIREKAALLDEAIAFCELATKDDNSPDNALQLVWYSTALVELVNYTAEDKAMHDRLELACQKAEAAKRYAFAPHPERPFLAKGNALEDFGWVLGVHTRWEEAIAEFTEAERSARGNDDQPARAKALLNRGRARLKYTQSGADRQADEDLTLALADLQEAAESGLLPPKYQAEAYYWQTNVSAAQKDFAAAEQSQAKAVEAIGPDGDSWVTHQLKWADVPVRHARDLLAQGGQENPEVERLLAAARDRYQAVFAGKQRSIRPDHRAEAFGRLAQIRLTQKQPDQALQDYDQALADVRSDSPTIRIDLLLQMSLFITDQRTGVFAKGDNAQKSVAAAEEALHLLGRDPTKDLVAAQPEPADDPVRVAEAYAARAYALQETYFGKKKAPDLLESLRSFQTAVRVNPRLRTSREWRKDVAAMSIASSRLEKDPAKKLEYLTSAKEFLVDPATRQVLEGLQDSSKKLADELKKVQP